MLPPSIKPAPFVVVDNTNPTLTYSPSNWTSYTGEGMNEVGDWGPPYQQTLHRISGDGSVSFSYNGRFIHAYASFNNTAEGSIPKWRCLVDGHVIANVGLPEYPNNNWEICNSAGTDISEGVHDFTLEVTGVGNNTMFWLDWIAYRPPDGYFVKDGTMFFPQDAVDIAYSGMWQRWGPYDQIGAAEEGASVVLTYRGVSLRWYGFLWGVPTPSIGKGVYTVDGGSPMFFTWESKKTHTTYRHVFFQTPVAQLGPHIINVTFLGSTPDLLPLSFTHLHVEIRSDTSVTMKPTVNLHRLSTIYGGVLGGLSAIFLFGAIGCVIVWRCRQESRWKRSPVSEQPAEAGITEAPKSTPLHKNSKELGNDSGLPSKDAPVSSCEDEHHQEIQLSPGPSHSNAIS